jgi:hypothetical protein
MGLQALFLYGRFGNSAGGVGPDIISNILSKFRLIEMFLQHYHCLFNTKVSCHPTVGIFQISLMHLLEGMQMTNKTTQKPILKMEISDD